MQTVTLPAGSGQAQLVTIHRLDLVTVTLKQRGVCFSLLLKVLNVFSESAVRFTWVLYFQHIPLLKTNRADDDLQTTGCKWPNAKRLLVKCHKRQYSVTDKLGKCCSSLVLTNVCKSCDRHAAFYTH